MPEVNPPANSDAAEARPHVKIPSPAAPIGKCYVVTLPIGHDLGSQSSEKGESSSGPSLQYAKKVVMRVLSSWIETLLSGHLDVARSKIPHVKEILKDAEEDIGLDVTDARAIVDRIIALGDRWFETTNYPDDQFFQEMFLNPAEKAQSELKETSQGRKQLVRERNRAELDIIRLQHDLNILDGEVEEARKHLEHLKAQVASTWTAITEARDRESALIHEVAEADQILNRKARENERWQAARDNHPGVAEGKEPSLATHGRFLKKRALETLTDEVKSLLEELKAWLESIFG